VRRMLALAVLLVALLSLGLVFPLWQWCTRLLEAARQAGPEGALLYAAAFIPAALLLLPSAPLALAAGNVFGPVAGTLVAVAGTALGATAAFAAGRFVGGDALRRLLTRSRHLSPFTRALEHAGFEVVFWLRLSPFVPFYLLNYAFGTTGLRARDYFAASALALVPGSAMYAFLGSLLFKPDKLAATGLDVRHLGALAVAAALSLLAALAGRARLPRLVRTAVSAADQRAARAGDRAGPPGR